MLRRFRAAPRPWLDVSPDVVLHIARGGDPPPDSRRGDVLCVERSATQARVRCDLMTLDVNMAVNPARATLTIHAPGWADVDLEHCFAVFVHKLLQLCDLVRLHGAAIEIGGGTHVLLGDKGSGKSTLSLALGQAGGHVLADDQIVIRRREGAVLVSGCDSNIRLTEQTERHLLGVPLETVPQDFAGTLKKEVTLEGLVKAIPYRDRAATRIYFPRVGDRVHVRPITGRDALLRILNAIAPAHGFAGQADRWHLMQIVTDFVTPARCFDVELSPNLDDLGQFISFLRT